MVFGFISLNKLGVGPVLIRHNEIILFEATPCNYTRLDLSTGNHIIVEDDFLCILNKIKAAELLREQK